jgi:hypothetical protein
MPSIELVHSSFPADSTLALSPPSLETGLVPLCVIGCMRFKPVVFPAICRSEAQAALLPGAVPKR